MSLCKLLPLATLLFLPLPMAAQSPEAAEVWVQLSSETSAPSKDVSLPLYLKVPPEMKLSRVEARVMFAATWLDVKEVKIGEDGRQAGVSLTHDVEKNPEKTVLVIKAGHNEGDFLPEGELAVLTLHVRQSAPETSLILGLEARAWSPNSAEPLSHVRASEGVLIVTRTGTLPVFGCFFYMH
ncbi:MAG: hypothetical protein HY645_11830 [Acidobacteria bacterium]|nr:hypothetical protein [Acidobacteriota bacterium]